MPAIGAGWLSETELYYRIKSAFPDLEVTQHARPSWLGRQHLDVYISECNIGVEYQGAQHYVAVDFFGGEEGLKQTQERDARKKQACEENGCALIYVNEGYVFDEVATEIEEIMPASLRKRARRAANLRRPGEARHDKPFAVAPPVAPDPSFGEQHLGAIASESSVAVASDTRTETSMVQRSWRKLKSFLFD